MVPTPRLIWLVAAVGFPAAVLAALSPASRFVDVAAIGLVAAAAIGDALLKNRALAGVRVELPPLSRFFKDRGGEIAVRIHNPELRGRRVRIGIPALDGLRMPAEEQLADLPDSAGASVIRWQVNPLRRGRYFLDACYLEADSPWGMWAVRRRDAAASEIRVYPNLRRDDDLKALRRGVEGWHALRQIGRGREFEKLREYVAGDGLDEIHWKASGRRGRPITKVFQVERTQEVYAILDASRLSARPVGEETAFERAVSASLVLGSAAERRGDLFGLAAFAQQVEAFTRARNGKAHYAACRDSIYQLHPRPLSPDFEEIATFLRLRLRRRALLVFLTALDDPVLAENFTRATQSLARRHLVIAAMPRPESAQPLFQDERVESAGQVYERLAGHLSWRRLRELEGTLARQGVRLALLDPARFSTGLVALYDEVKQRQLL
jgi:uncharacterized protein (DUF58 family)